VSHLRPGTLACPSAQAEVARHDGQPARREHWADSAQRILQYG